MSINFDTIQTPYLIQRGTFQNIKEEEIVGLDSLISYDYMGSSEFEWGALPASLRRMTSSFSKYVWFPVEEIKDADRQCLYILCQKHQQDEITNAVKILATEEHNTFNTKERVGLQDYINCRSQYSMNTNFWWDVTSSNHSFSETNLGTGNDWMACFGNNIRLLVIAIYKVCEKHKNTPKIGPSIPPKSNLSVRPDLKIDDFSKRDTIIISYPDGRNTIILKRKITEVNDQDNDMIKVLVQNKTGNQKWIEIKIGLSSTRSLLLNMLKDWPEINKIKKS